MELTTWTWRGIKNPKRSGGAGERRRSATTDGTPPFKASPSRRIGRACRERFVFSARKCKKAESSDSAPLFPGRVLLSRVTYGHSTIGAGGLNCRVRDGNGCFTSAMTTGILAPPRARFPPPDISASSARMSAAAH